MEVLIFVDMLNANGVSILKQKFITDEETGERLQVGGNWRKAYVNSVSGREELIREVSEPYLSAILALWGEIPTVEEQESGDVE